MLVYVLDIIKLVSILRIPGASFTSPPACFAACCRSTFTFIFSFVFIFPILPPKCFLILFWLINLLCSVKISLLPKFRIIWLFINLCLLLTLIWFLWSLGFVDCIFSFTLSTSTLSRFLSIYGRIFSLQSQRLLLLLFASSSTTPVWFRLVKLSPVATPIDIIILVIYLTIRHKYK